MIISHVELQNWRNFKSAEADLKDVTYVLGPNASGKSNFLDCFRFLRDIAKSNGGGLQKAVTARGGLKKVRCLHARSKPEVGIVIEVSEEAAPVRPSWRYELFFNSEGKGRQRPIVARERVFRYDGNGQKRELLSRPDAEDKKDVERLTQTALEQIQANLQFRPLAEFLANTTYVHLVPQLLKYADEIGGRKLEDDPFGQGFLERLARTTDGTRRSRLKRIEVALKSVIPQIEQLEFVNDAITGLPHLEARYKHHRPRAGIQREDQFSDGTLRLISLFWLIMEGQSLLLLEEPELSLNEEIVEKLPALIARVQRGMRRRRQIVITTHSSALLSNAGISGDSLLILVPSDEGTNIDRPTEAENTALASGFSPAEVVLPRAQNPIAGKQLELQL
jgi:predicted ATPase